MATLTEFQTRKWTHLFHIYDVDGNGVVTREDFDLKAQAVARIRNIELADDQYRQLHAKIMEDWEKLQHTVDTNNDHKVSLSEWLDHGAVITNDAEMYETVMREAEEVFDAFDADKDGVLQRDEVIVMLTAWGVDTEAMASTFSRLDRSGDGRLSTDKLKTLLRQFHHSDNPDDPGNYFFGPF